MKNLDTFILDLLNIDAPARNRLIDLEGAGREKTYYLTSTVSGNTSADVLTVIGERIGKTANTVLKGSAKTGEQIIGRHKNVFDWCDGSGARNPAELDRYVKGVYKDIALKGNNPLFLGVGAISWRLRITRDEVKTVKTPLIIFPIRLIRSDSVNPISVEFIDEEIYVNPCFIAKLGQIYGEDTVKGFPHPNGEGVDFDTPINLITLGNGEEYFSLVSQYISRCSSGDSATVFEFDKNTVAIAQYKHDAFCMYYDVRKNRALINESPLVKRLFSEKLGGDVPKVTPYASLPLFVREVDTNQEKIIGRVLSGESIIVKGPPGSGKTHTIVNMISTLLAEGKKVLMVSEKLAALSEIYNKLPTELNDFVMLLESESEAEAAKLSPSEIKRELAELTELARRTPKLSSSVYEDKKGAEGERYRAMMALGEYYDETFTDGAIIGASYFEALDTVLKNHSIKTVPYISAEAALDMTREQYNACLSVVGDMGSRYLEATGGGAHGIMLSPWYPLSGELHNTEAALNAYKELASLIEKAKVALDGAFSEARSAYRGIPLGTLERLFRLAPTEEEILSYLGISEDKLSAIREGLKKLRKTDADEGLLSKLTLSPGADTTALYRSLSQLECDKELKLSEYEGLTENEEMLSRISQSDEAAAKVVIAGMDRLYSEAKELELVTTRVLRRDLSQKELETVRKCSLALSKYTEEDSAPKFFDFAAKGAVKKLRALSFLSEPRFIELISAARALCHREEVIARINQKLDDLRRIMRTDLSEGALNAIALLIRRSRDTGVSAAEYMRRIVAAKPALSALNETASVEKELTLRELGEAVLLYGRLIKLSEAVSEALEIKSEVSLGAASLKEAYMLAERISAIRTILSEAKLEGDGHELAATLSSAVKDKTALSDMLLGIIDRLISFGKTYFETLYSVGEKRLAFADLDIILSEATDRTVIRGMQEYLLSKAKYPTLARFFLPFEEEGRSAEGFSFTEIFEHSTFELATLEYRERLAKRNGRGASYAENIEKYLESEKKIRAANVALIRDVCLGRINPDDADFAFLNATRDNMNTLRRIFKLHADAILKLKRCFLMSPSTVSVLFDSPSFSEFDVVIADEASQLEPTALLPILFRTKQIVLVGDEWQMPPIKHFAKAREHAIEAEGGEMTILPPDTSALSLAINSNQFAIERLSLHFRSKTESLISFSQGKYYPYMRTFPSPVPRGNGLGFKDVFIENGFSEGGVNEAEAKSAVAELRRHFKYYYSPDTGILSESVGVVAFGENQLERIIKLVNADKELSSMISRAKASFGELHEKLIFFKTIETVQGQEIEHLIISFTYGKGKDGRVREAYGDLGKSEIGECIFNVAVTRAKSSVTMIHSVLPEEIKNPYIKEYLELCRLFDGAGTESYSVGGGEPTAFTLAVSDFLTEEAGIDPERVIIGCGVTRGSVRVPIAILSPDKSRAELGIYLEGAVIPDEFIDHNARYFNILAERGWQLHRVCIHDWVDNAEVEKRSILEAVSSFVTK